MYRLLAIVLAASSVLILYLTGVVKGPLIAIGAGLVVWIAVRWKNWNSKQVRPRYEEIVRKKIELFRKSKNDRGSKPPEQ
jgi:TRAP-type C4-dicarboxylate transport system permease large subunit